MTEDDFERVQWIIQNGASRGARFHRRYLSYSDARQIAELWVLEHPRKVEEYLEDGKRGERRLAGRLTRAVDAAARVEKAQALGYKPEDEQFYDRGMVELVLPAIFEEGYKPWVDKDKAGRARRADPSQMGEWEAMVADVRHAWVAANLPAEVRDALVRRFSDHHPMAVIAAIQGVHVNTVQQRIGKGMASLVEQLGGFDPKCHPDCECGGPGSRKVITNAHARALSDSCYDES